MPIICESEPTMQGFFFSGGGATSSCPRQVGNVIPTIATYPDVFLMLRNEPRYQGKPGGSEFPQLLHPGGTQSSWGAGGIPLIIYSS